MVLQGTHNSLFHARFAQVEVHSVNAISSSRAGMHILYHMNTRIVESDII